MPIKPEEKKKYLCCKTLKWGKNVLLSINITRNKRIGNALSKSYVIYKKKQCEGSECMLMQTHMHICRDLPGCASNTWCSKASKSRPCHSKLRLLLSKFWQRQLEGDNTRHWSIPRGICSDKESYTQLAIGLYCGA